jgi:non-ribosomal peptide synthetase component E (peptide arylation enzyme)
MHASSCGRSHSCLLARFAHCHFQWQKRAQEDTRKQPARAARLHGSRGALADFKVPREIRFVDEMPRPTLEKVAKAELRKMLV